MRRFRNWLNGFDRCNYDGRRMWTRSGYTMCRKHGVNTWVP